MRYTEIRMERIAHELLADLDKETVDYVPNYDGTEKIPDVLPTKIPNLLVNGSAGIAVGMATNIPPHNLTEVINGCLAFLDDSTLSVSDLMEFIPAPELMLGLLSNRVSCWASKGSANSSQAAPATNHRCAKPCSPIAQWTPSLAKMESRSSKSW